MLLNPEQYAQAPVYDLLNAASRGEIGLDHRWLHAIVDRGASAVPDTLRFAGEDHSDAPINLEEDLIAILRFLKAPDALPFYVACVRRQPEEVSDELVEALHEIGQPAVEPLLKLYHEFGEENSGDLAFLLSSLRVHDPRILDVLLEHTEFDLADGALCLGLYGDPAAKPKLEQILEELNPKDSEQANLRHEVRTALDQIDQPRTDEPVPPFNVWELYPETAPPELDLLDENKRLDYLASSDVETRAEAAATFFNQDLTTVQRDHLFKVAQNDADASVRARAWEALASQTDHPPIRAALLSTVQSPETSVEERGGALVALASEMDDPQVRDQTVAMYADESGRAKALEAMWRSMDKSFAGHFSKHLGDANEEVQRQAIWGVGYMGIGAEAGKLQKLFENQELRADALFAYALSAPGEVSRSRVKSFLRKIDQLAGGLSSGEVELVQVALDERLALNGQQPYFFAEEAREEAAVSESRSAEKVGRNDPCPCGSGKKYKKCCGE